MAIGGEVFTAAEALAHGIVDQVTPRGQGMAAANAMAQRLATQLSGIEGLEFVCPVSCNMLFPRLPEAALHALQQEFYFYTWREADHVARWLTSFDTTAADVDEFASAVIRTLKA